MVSAKLFILCWNLLSGSSEASPWNVQLASSDGSTVQWASFLGRPTVLFYEDRQSLETNREMKEVLTQLLAARGWVQRTQVLAVANLKEFNWFPASQFALAGVRRAEAKNGVTVYVDFDGVLAARLGDKDAKGSWVVLLSPNGDILYRYHGAMNSSQRQKLLALLTEATEKPWRKATASAN